VAPDAASQAQGLKRQTPATEIAYTPPEGVFLGASPNVQLALDDLYSEQRLAGESLANLHATSVQAKCASLGGTLETVFTDIKNRTPPVGPYKLETYCVPSKPTLGVDPNPLVLSFVFGGTVTIQNLGLATTLGNISCLAGDCAEFRLGFPGDGDYCSSQSLPFLGGCQTSIHVLGSRCVAEATFGVDPNVNDADPTPVEFTVRSFHCIN
jgi:hypothetical protein